MRRGNLKKYSLGLLLWFSLSGSIPAQVQEWVARYREADYVTNKAAALAIDRDGYVYVTGASDGRGTGLDYATIKYDPDGNQVWVARYNGPGNWDDKALALAVDGEGNVYVTGDSWGIGTREDYATIKYDREGKEVWVARYNGPGNLHDIPQAIVVDPEQNVYVTGMSVGAGTAEDYATIKYDPDGNQVWVARYNGPGNSGDAASAIALDPQGNVYVTGGSWGGATYDDYATIKYDLGGNQLWVARYNGPGNRNDIAWALIVDSAGNVYVTGESVGVGTDYDYATIKYDPEGNQLWVARYDGPAHLFDRASAIALDPAGNVYVTGLSSGIGVYYACTIKYDPNGQEVWRARYSGLDNFYNDAWAIALDLAGNVYITGESRWISGGGDLATLKYDSDGKELWAVRYNGIENGVAIALALAVDSAANVYVTGWNAGEGSQDYVTLKYSQK